MEIGCHYDFGCVYLGHDRIYEEDKLVIDWKVPNV
jgi:hypothetical protein